MFYNFFFLSKPDKIHQRVDDSFLVFHNFISHIILLQTCDSKEKKKNKKSECKPFFHSNILWNNHDDDDDDVELYLKMM